MKNYYHILDLKNFASLQEIRRQYRRLALVHHPDRGGDSEKMKEINNAYDFLMKNKVTYDHQLRPERPVLNRTGFTIIVNGWGYGFETSNSTSSGVFATAGWEKVI